MENNNQQNLSPEQPPISPMPPTPAKKLSNKIIAIILLAVIAGIVSWIALSRQPKTDLSPIVVNHKTETPATTTPPIVQSGLDNSNSTTPDSVPPRIVQQAVVKEIKVKAGVDVSPQQDSTFDFRTANGHYLLWTFDNNTLIYDGQKIYQGKNLDSIGLSKNGLHYGYSLVTNSEQLKTVYDTANDDLYIDGQKIISAQNIQSINISDDGKHYMFASKINSGPYIANAKVSIFKDGESLYEAPGISMIVSMNRDGSSYSAIFSPTGATYELVINGQVAKDNLDGNYSDFVFSPNNKHYAYQTAQAIIVDGQTKFQKSDAGSQQGCLQITDEGHYAFCDYESSSFVIDGKSYPSPLVGGGGVSININSDATHYLIFNSKNWILDGKNITFKTINPQWQEYGAEIVDDTVYIYSLVR